MDGRALRDFVCVRGVFSKPGAIINCGKLGMTTMMVSMSFRLLLARARSSPQIKTPHRLLTPPLSSPQYGEYPRPRPRPRGAYLQQHNKQGSSNQTQHHTRLRWAALEAHTLHDSRTHGSLSRVVPRSTRARSPGRAHARASAPARWCACASPAPHNTTQHTRQGHEGSVISPSAEGARLNTRARWSALPPLADAALVLQCAGTAAGTVTVENRPVEACACTPATSCTP